MMEVVAIGQTDGAKEVLVSLGLMKLWDLIQDTFPLKSVYLYVARMSEENKSSKN